MELSDETNLAKVCEVPFNVDLVSVSMCHERVLDAGESIPHIISNMMFIVFRGGSILQTMQKTTKIKRGNACLEFRNIVPEG